LLNPQNPFAFQISSRRKNKKAKTATQLSPNIKGICPSCKNTVQRIKKFDENGTKLPPALCLKCLKQKIHAEILEIPDTMKPWRIQDASNDHSYYWDRRFQCSDCNKYYFDFFTFGSLCKHRGHIPPNGYMCRLCCKHIDDSVPKEPKTKKAGLKRAATEEWAHVNVPLRAWGAAFDAGAFLFRPNEPEQQFIPQQQQVGIDRIEHQILGPEVVGPQVVLRPEDFDFPLFQNEEEVF
jgi:hypothetical protein